MEGIPLSNLELEQIKPGEPLTIGAILTILAISLCIVAAYKLFISSDGKIKLPGSYQFEWKM